MAVLVVLVENCDPRPSRTSEDVLAVDRSFFRVGRREADRPRVLPVVAAERRRAGSDEELRHAQLVEEPPDREVAVRPQRAEHREHLVLLHEPGRVAQRSSGVVAVVEVPERDPAAEDTTLRIHVFEVRVGAPRDVARRLRLAAQRDGRTELDLGRRDAGNRERPSTGVCDADGRDDRGDQKEPQNQMPQTASECTGDLLRV